MDTSADSKISTPFSLLSKSNVGGIRMGQHYSPSITTPKTNGQNRSTTPMDSKAASSDIENEDPNPTHFTLKKKKHEHEDSSYSIKAKRLKKLVSQASLPEIGSVDDVLKLSEELNDYRQKVTTLADKQTELQTQLELVQTEKDGLIKSKNQLKEQLKESQNSKNVLLFELSEKTKATMALESEMNAMANQLSQERAKIQDLEHQLATQKQENASQVKVIESLNKAIEEQTIELRMKQQMCDDVKMQEQKTTEQLEEMNHVNKELHTKLQKEYEVYHGSITKMESQIGVLKQEFFISTALAIKLNLTASGIACDTNVEIQSLYEKVLESNTPLNEWPRWITKQMLC